MPALQNIFTVNFLSKINKENRKTQHKCESQKAGQKRKNATSPEHEKTRYPKKSFLKTAILSPFPMCNFILKKIRAQAFA